jgi:hypothetical protein
MSTSKRHRAPLVVTLGVLTAMVTFAGPASAADSVYPPSAGSQVLSSNASSGVPAAAASTSAATATSGLAFTGANAIGVGVLGGLLLAGGTTLVLVGKRRKVNS